MIVLPIGYCLFEISNKVKSEQLFTEVEVNSGGYLPSRAAAG